MSVVINGSAGVTTNSGAVYDGIQSGTAVASTSGTSIDFIGIPSWVKRITVMFSGVSTSGTSNIQIQLGDSSGIATTGYLNAATVTGSGVGTVNYTSGMAIEPTNVNITSASIRNGSAHFELVSGNTFVGSGTFGHSNAALTTFFGGSKTLSATLDRVRVTTANGTDTFDAGSINILYE